MKSGISIKPGSHGTNRLPARPRLDGAARLQTRITAFLLPAVQLATVLLFAAWGLLHLHGYTYSTAPWLGPHGWSDYDEGVYLVSARLMNQGFPLFSSVFSSQPPLFITGLAVFLRVFHDAAGAGYLYSLSFGLLALGGVLWLSWECSGRWSATMAAVVLALSPGFVIAAHAIEAEAPMMGLAAVSAAAAARYARTSSRLWLCTAALLLAAATLMKLLGVLGLAPLAAAIVLQAAGTPARARLNRCLWDALFAAFTLLVPIAASFALFSPRQQFDQVVMFHTKASAIPGLAQSTADTFGVFKSWDPGLIALGATGIAIAAVLRLRTYAIPISWFVVTLVSTLLYYPLFLHHLTVLLPPLAACAGACLAPFDVSVVRPMARRTALLLCALSAAVYSAWLPSTFGRATGSFSADSNRAKSLQVAWLQSHAAEGEFVLTDNQVLAVAAHRLVPPELSDTSNVRWRSGYLSLQLLEQSTAKADVTAVLLTRTLQFDPPFVRWLGSHYHVAHSLGVPGILFTR